MIYLFEFSKHHLEVNIVNIVVCLKNTNSLTSGQLLVISIDLQLTILQSGLAS